MINRSMYLALCLALGHLACSPSDKTDKTEKWQKEIRDREFAFMNMVQEKGLHKAFVAYADEDAVLLRGEQLIRGRQAIDSFYSGRDLQGLTWEPEHIEVAASGDLAFTYGPYTYTLTDSTGQEKKLTGFFHTVWKRQKDGSWLYVWD